MPMAPWSEPLTQPKRGLYPAAVAFVTSWYCLVALRTISTSLLWSPCPCGCVFCCARANEVRARRAAKSIVRCDSFFMFGSSLVLAGNSSPAACWGTVRSVSSFRTVVGSCQECNPRGLHPSPKFPPLLNDCECRGFTEPRLRPMRTVLDLPNLGGCCYAYLRAWRALIAFRQFRVGRSRMGAAQTRCTTAAARSATASFGRSAQARRRCGHSRGAASADLDHRHFCRFR